VQNLQKIQTFFVLEVGRTNVSDWEFTKKEQGSDVGCGEQGKLF